MARNFFSKKKDEALIELVRRNPILYDPYHNHFRNVIMKHEKWQHISKSLEIPILHVKNRWRHFKDHYLKKLKMQENGVTSGKPWDYMQLLEFLALTKMRFPDPETGPSARETSDGEDTRLFDKEDSDTEQPKQRRRQSARSAAVDAPEGSDPGSELSPRPSASEAEKTPVHKFFESMADVVAQFPPRLAADTRLRVCQLITEMELKMHTELLDWQELRMGPIKQEET